MTEIKRVKEVVEEVINTGNFTRLLNLIRESEGELVDIGITKWLAKTVLSLITTIESLQEKHREELQVLMNSSNTKIWNLQDDVKQKDALIESQKEEIERMYAINQHLEIDFQSQKEEIEKLKQQLEYEKLSPMQKASRAIDQIERLSHEQNK